MDIQKLLNEFDNFINKEEVIDYINLGTGL